MKINPDNSSTARYTFRVVLLIAIALLPARVFAYNPPDTTDSAKKYDLNDPRNPDCPCHQYQKQADEEYERTKKQQETNNNPVAADPAKDAQPKSGDQSQHNGNSDSDQQNSTDNPQQNNAEDQSQSERIPDNAQQTTADNTEQTHATADDDRDETKSGKKNHNSHVLAHKAKKLSHRMARKRNGTKHGRHRLANCFHWD